jgi:hypothetical protein
MKRTLEEAETHLNMTGDNRTVWECFSDDPVMVGRLDKIATAYKDNGVGGKWYRLEARQVLIRAVPAPRKLSVEQRQKAAERLALSRLARQKQG